MARDDKPTEEQTQEQPKAEANAKPAPKPKAKPRKKATKKKAAPKKAKGKSRMAAARGLLKKALPSDDTMVEVDENRWTKSRPHISSGSIAIDYLIGGKPNIHGVAPCPGFPRGMVVNLYGHESSGKTTLALETAAAVCAAGGTVCFIDWEHALDLGYAKALGVPVNDDDVFALAQPPTLEEGIQVLWAMLLAGIDLIVIDSVGAAVPAAVFKQELKDKGKQGRVGILAATWSQLLPQVRAVAAKTNSCIIGISQLRMKIDTGGGKGGGPRTTQQGGEAWKFYSDVRLILRRKAQEKAQEYSGLVHKNQEKIVGTVSVAKMDKCRVAASQGHEANFYIRFGEGVDNLRSIVDIAAAHGIVTKKGAWYNWLPPGADDDDAMIKGQGVHQFKAALKATDGAVPTLHKLAIAALRDTGEGITGNVDEDGTPVDDEEELGDLAFLTK